MRQAILITVFSVLLFFTGCLMPKCKGRNCEVEMVHYHDGTEYRGTIWYKFIRNKNPRYGYWYPNMVKDPGALHKKK